MPIPKAGQTAVQLTTYRLQLVPHYCCTVGCSTTLATSYRAVDSDDIWHDQPNDLLLGWSAYTCISELARCNFAVTPVPEKYQCIVNHVTVVNLPYNNVYLLRPVRRIVPEVGALLELFPMQKKGCHMTATKIREVQEQRSACLCIGYSIYTLVQTTMSVPIAYFAITAPQR